ncbi:MAG: N-acetylmuramoyl-L-alanine amidase, partial [Verrucomicrobiales bacterium]
MIGRNLTPVAMAAACLKPWRLFFLATILLLNSGCRSAHAPGSQLKRSGDEIVVAGQLFHTGTPVVLWMDEGGYDAYRVERRFSPLTESSWEVSKEKVKGLSSPNRYGMRQSLLTDAEAEKVRGGGWDLPLLQDKVDQFVIHYDVAGTSRQCFKILHDMRSLSVHFMLDLDGTIYQTLDLKERAWHAGVANSRSIGIEIANMGAYPPLKTNTLEEWYKPDAEGMPMIVVPERFGETGIRTTNFVGRPIRPEPVTGAVQQRELVQYDLTPQQYRALARLTATLCSV